MADEHRAERDRLIDLLHDKHMKIYMLGQENAKLAKKVHNQRLAINELTGHRRVKVETLDVEVQHVMRLNRIIQDQNVKLTAENKALRVHIATTRMDGLAGALKTHQKRRIWDWRSWVPNPWRGWPD